LKNLKRNKMARKRKGGKQQQDKTTGKSEYVPQSVRPPKQITPQTVKDKFKDLGNGTAEGKQMRPVPPTPSQDKNWEEVKNKARASGKRGRKYK
jgi:hypothetical protein